MAQDPLVPTVVVEFFDYCSFRAVEGFLILDPERQIEAMIHLGSEPLNGASRDYLEISVLLHGRKLEPPYYAESPPILRDGYTANAVAHAASTRQLRFYNFEAGKWYDLEFSRPYKDEALPRSAFYDGG